MLVKNFAVVDKVFDEVPIGNENPTRVDSLKHQVDFVKSLMTRVKQVASVKESQMGQDYNSTRSGFEDIRTVLGDDVAVPSDTVRMNKRRHQKNGDGVKTYPPQKKP
ncbi:hypothetical protein Tco_1037525 [Tanacetum coccineum]